MLSRSIVAATRSRARRRARCRRAGHGAQNGRSVADHSAPAVVARVRARRLADRRDRSRDADERVRFVRCRNTSRRRSSPSRISASTSTTASTSSAVARRDQGQDRRREPRRRQHDHAAARRLHASRHHRPPRDQRHAGISRKLHEQSAAREMERHYTKEQILEAYLNQINLGRGWYGVDAGCATLLRASGGAS